MGRRSAPGRALKHAMTFLRSTEIGELVPISPINPARTFVSSIPLTILDTISRVMSSTLRSSKDLVQGDLGIVSGTHDDVQAAGPGNCLQGERVAADGDICGIDNGPPT